MKVLMLSQDEKIFETDSAVARRIASYGTVMDSLVVVVFGAGERKERLLASNVRAVFLGGKNKIDSFFRSSRALSSIIKEEGVEVVSSQDPFFLGIAGLRAARKSHVRFQAQLHTDCFSFAYAFQSFRNLIETLVAFCVVQCADSVRVVSERIARSVAHFSNVSTVVLPIRVSDIEETNTQKPPEFGALFSVVSVGRMTPEKRLHLLIDAISSVPDVDLILVGDGPLRASLEAQAKRLGVSDRVSFSGWQNPHPYYAYADVYMSASRFEGYGMSLMEAALHGLPIVTTDTGIVGDILRDRTEAIVVLGDARSMRDALVALIANPALRTEIGAAARKRAHGTLVSESEYLKRYADVLGTKILKTPS